jgi:hypothetical protein
MKHPADGFGVGFDEGVDPGVGLGDGFEIDDVATGCAPDDVVAAMSGIYVPE